MSDFDLCLKALHDDRDQATQLYLTFQRKLLTYFDTNHCQDSVSWSGIVMDRFCEIASTTMVSKPRELIFSIAWHVRHECWRSQRLEREAAQEATAELAVAGSQEDAELELAKVACRRRCLAQLPVKDRALIKRYNTPDGDEKLYVTRERLAAELGLPLPELRKRILGVRKVLRQCFEHCFSESVKAPPGRSRNEI